jgi:hypothetical protein
MMRTLSIVCLATTLLAGSALAGSPAPDNTGATAQQLQTIEGAYKLSNGRILRLSTIDNRLYGDINGFHRTELVAAAENVFASRDGAIKVTYKPETATSLEQIAVSYERDPGALARASSERGRGSLWASR